MHDTEASRRHDFLRLSLIGFAFVVLTSPFVVLMMAESMRYYHPYRELLPLAYPAVGTLLCAMFLASSTNKTHQSVKIIVIPVLTFSLLTHAILTKYYGPGETYALWALLGATIWLSGILRQRAFSDGYRNSPLILFGHQVVGFILGITCLAGLEDFAICVALMYWFGAVACYLNMWVESRNGPRQILVTPHEPVAEL